MAIPASGPLSLSDIQTEFGGSNPISLNEYYAGGSYVPAGTTGTYGAVPSSGEISIRNFYGTSAFAAVFNNAENINLNSRGSFGFTYQATYTINTDATCSKLGLPFGLSFSGGPTAWGTPTGGTPGNNFEARLNVTSFSTAGGSDYVRFAGANITSTGYTSWYALSSNRAIDAVGATDISYVEGTLYIRNTVSLVEISRQFAVYADPTF